MTDASNESLLEFLYSLPIGLVEFSADGRLGRINPTVAQTLMPQVGQQGFDNAFTLLMPLAPDLRTAVEQQNVDGVVHRSRKRLCDPHGRARTFDTTVHRAGDRYIAVISDATPEAEALARMEAFFEVASDGIHILDQQGYMIECSPSFSRMLGYSRSEALGLHVSQWDAEIPSAEIDAIIQRLLQGEQPTFETRHRRKDGTLYDAEISATAVALGAETYIYAAARDISERKQAANELLELKHRYEQFFEANESIKLVFDWESGEIIQVNDAACAFYGYSREQLQALSISDINTAPPEEVMAELEAATDENRLYYEFRHRLASGEIREIEEYSGPVQIGDQTLVYAIIHDVTEDNRRVKEIDRERVRLAAIVQGTNAGTWEWNIQTGGIEINERWARILGYRAEELRPMNVTKWGELAHPDDLAEADPLMEANLRAETPRYVATVRMRHKDGHWVWLQEAGEVVSRTREGEPAWMYGTHMDITSLKSQELATTRALNKLEAIASAIDAGIVGMNNDLEVEYLSPRFTELFGYQKNDLRDWQAWTQRAACSVESREILRRALTGHAPGDTWSKSSLEGKEVKICTVGGQVRDALLSMHRTGTGPVLTFSDISTQKRREEFIEFSAQHDVLTGLSNRVLLSERIDWHLKQARRSRWLLCVAFVDLDGFKGVNDRFGHGAGDVVLKTVASRLKNAIREVDTVARLGGDEFAIAFTELKTREECAPLIRRVLEAVSNPIPYEGESLHVSASIGLSFFSQDPGIDSDQLLRQADKAMYDAKVAGKNRFAVFDPEADRSLRQQNRELEDIVHGLSENQFELYYQPKVNMRTGDLVGAEALLRWRQPPKDVLTPDAFLPVVYDHELSRELGAWVLARAMGDLEEMIKNRRGMPISVNVFPRQLLAPDFVNNLRRLLREHACIAPELLELEMVETAVLNEIDGAKNVIEACRDLGVTCALDDFGTGFSSLVHLKHLRVAGLKIDKSFVADMLRDPDDLAIVEGTLSLARAFSLTAIAEGVETIDQGSALLDLGCELAQGYAIARPMPLSDLYEWMDTWQAPAEWTSHRDRITRPSPRQ